MLRDFGMHQSTAVILMLFAKPAVILMLFAKRKAEDLLLELPEKRVLRSPSARIRMTALAPLAFGSHQDNCVKSLAAPAQDRHST